MALETISRSFGYISSIRLRDNSLHLKYPKVTVPLTRSFFRSARAVVQIYTYLVCVRVARLMRGQTPVGKIAFHPQSAAPWYNIWFVTQIAGLKTVSNPQDADYAFVFEDATHNTQRAVYSDTTNPMGINHKIENIAKNHVGEVFESVFGYPINIDPTTYQGRGIRKSEENGAHDGIVIDCPIEPSEVLPNYSYQRLVDSTFNGQTSEDLRIAVVYGEVPIVFHKHKAEKKRFGTDYLSVDLLEPQNVFSQDELEKIAIFSEKIGLDFGAVDVMRDKHDRRIYIVDVNKTCMPVLSLSLKQQMIAQRRVAASFMKNIEERRRNRQA